MAMFGHLKEMYQMHKRSTIDQMKALTSSTVNIFRSYRECHSVFLERNDPGPFRVFLQNANERFWALGFCVNALDHCRSEEHTSELQSLMRISYAVFCLKKK